MKCKPKLRSTLFKWKCRKFDRTRKLKKMLKGQGTTPLEALMSLVLDSRLVIEDKRQHTRRSDDISSSKSKEHRLDGKMKFTPRSISSKWEQGELDLMDEVKKTLKREEISPLDTLMTVLDSSLVYRGKRRSDASESQERPPKMLKASSLIRKIMETKDDNIPLNSIGKHENGSVDDSKPLEQNCSSSERCSHLKSDSQNDPEPGVESNTSIIQISDDSTDENMQMNTEATKTFNSGNTGDQSNEHLNQSNDQGDSCTSYDGSSEMSQSTIESEDSVYVSKRKMKEKLRSLILLRRNIANRDRKRREKRRKSTENLQRRKKHRKKHSPKVGKHIVSKAREKKSRTEQFIRRKSIVSERTKSRPTMRKSSMQFRHLIRTNQRTKNQQIAMKFAITEVDPNENTSNVMILTEKSKGDNSHRSNERDGCHTNDNWLDFKSGRHEERNQSKNSFLSNLCEDIMKGLSDLEADNDDHISGGNDNSRVQRKSPESTGEGPTANNHNIIAEYVGCPDSNNFFVEDAEIVDYVESIESIQSGTDARYENTHEYRDYCDVTDGLIDRFPIKIVEGNREGHTRSWRCLSAAEIQLKMSSRKIDPTSVLATEASQVNESSEGIQLEMSNHIIDPTTVLVAEAFEVNESSEESAKESIKTLVQIKTENVHPIHTMDLEDTPSDASNMSVDVRYDDTESQDDVVDVTTPIFFSLINCGQVLMLLKTKIYFNGALRIRLIGGQASIFGYELGLNETVIANSPRGHSFLYLSPSSSHHEHHNDENLEFYLKELSESFMSSDLEKIRLHFNSSTDAIVLLERDSSNKGIFMIEKYMERTIFPNVHTFHDKRYRNSSESILNCTFLRRTRTGLKINPKWNDIGMTSTSRQIIIGGKGVGKSTLLRYLINRNLKEFKKILLIDLDIGQPEMFLPQTVSATIVTEPMLGPGYLRNQSPYKSYLFGDINVLVSPIKYLKCVLKLLKYCCSCENVSTIPWVVNTMGYNRGFGLELIVAILKALNPTDVIQIQGRRSLDNFEIIFESEEVNKFCFNIFKDEVHDVTIDCSHSTFVYDTMSKRERKNVWDISPKDLRFAIILSKLGNILQGNDNWITDVKPICASLNDLKIIVVSDDCVNAHWKPNILNGNLVYLCQTKPDADSTDDNIVDCYGIGIVRAVEIATNRVYLLPSIPRIDMQCVNALAVCSIPLPSPIALTQRLRITELVPYVYSSDISF